MTVMVVNTHTISTALASITRISWSPDGKYLAVIGKQASGSAQPSSVLVYDARSLRLLQTLTPEPTGRAALGDVAFSPNGKYLAAGTGVITFWQTDSWSPLREIPGPYARGAYVAGGTNSIAFSPDSRSLAVLYDSVVFPESVRVDTPEQGAEIGRRVFAAKRDLQSYLNLLARDEIARPLQALMAFDVATGNARFSIRLPDNTPSRSGRLTANIVYTGSGKYLMSSRDEVHSEAAQQSERDANYLEFRDPATGAIVREMKGVHVMELTAIAASADGEYLATATHTTRKVSTLNPVTNQWEYVDNRDPIRIWRIVTGEKVTELGGLRGAPRCLVFSRDGRLLVSSQPDIQEHETIWLWDVRAGRDVLRLKTPSSSAGSLDVALSPDDHSLAAPVDGDIYIFSLEFS